MVEKEKVILKEKKRSQAWADTDKVGYVGCGKRKTSVARVWLRKGTGQIFIDREKFVSTRSSDISKIMIPLKLVKAETRYDVHAFVTGGGTSARIDAIAHGVSRALLKINPENRAVLKPEGCLTRDSREKERKKYFHKRARKRTQFRKR